MVLTEVGEDGMEWMSLVQERDKLRAFANTVMDL
jgi:hypothetical protein